MCVYIRFMVLVIGGEEITVESTAEPDATYDDMLEVSSMQIIREPTRFVLCHVPHLLFDVNHDQRLPFTDCRYVVFDKEFTTHDGRKTNKLFFVAWLPHKTGRESCRERVCQKV